MRGCDHRSIPLLCLKLRGRWWRVAGGRRRRERAGFSRWDQTAWKRGSVEAAEAEEETGRNGAGKTMREARRGKDSQTLTGGQLSGISVEATVPIQSKDMLLDQRRHRHLRLIAHYFQTQTQ